ncbi:hypothetical protein JMF97_08150 [Micromonospora fiedleri]|uniref:Uncharacterized protein n=1 Tax=Micromonospora fiedleri TaxID=1157498 RepID=A0ABS1UMJ2_9ACTN|nr:hypothetical protein [Micromonospora fiedleri]MBL6276130.1 hypothetical protein [Micromonospora fiedleri]
MPSTDSTDQPTPDGPTEAEVVPWARQPTPPRQRHTDRVRRIAEGLPDWEPMPPGEMVIRRPRQG